MPNDFYADAGPDQAETPQQPAQDSASDSNVATLPKQVLGGKEFKPGEELTLKIVQVMEDSVLVEYAGGEEAEQEAPPEPEQQAPAPAPGPGGGMASLME